MKKKSHGRLATEIMGSKIFSRQGENIGIIQNFMLYPASGITIYIVLCYANFMGKINRYFAIPGKVLKADPADNRSFILDENWEALLNAPCLSTDKWPLPSWSRNDRHVYELTQETDAQ